LNNSISTSSGSGDFSTSSSSAINNRLNNLEISTNSSTTQFLGLTSRVLINATTRPVGNFELEWFVNDQKSLTQKGLEFEFFPTTINTYKIYAKSGNIISNEITVSVALPKFNLTSVVARSSNQIEVKGDPGLTFSITGLSIASTSSFNILNQTYNINLLNNMVQGTTYNMVVSRAGFENLSYQFTYETRLLVVGYILYDSKKITPSSDGTFAIEKPFGESLTRSYQIFFNHTNLEGTSVPISIVTNVPSTASAIQPYQTTVNIERNSAIQSNTFNVESATQAGIYVHNVSINNFNLTVRVSIVNPVPKLTVETPLVFKRAAVNGTPITNPFEVDEEDEYVNDEFIIKQENNGQYVVYRPYNGNAFELTFILRAANFPNPVGFPVPSLSNPTPPAPYTILAGLVGPNGGIMNYANTFNSSPPSTFPVREDTGDSYRVSLFIDNRTTLGTYTYTFTASGFGINLTRTVSILIRDFVPTIEPIIKYNSSDTPIKPNADGSYTIYKPLGSNVITTSIEAKISNYESPLASTHTGGTGTTNLFTKSTILRYFLDTRITYSGPLSSVTPLVSKIGLILGAQNPSSEPVTNQSDSQDTFTYQLFYGTENSRTINLLALRDAATYTAESNSNIFDSLKTITVNTFPGIHTFNVQIGAISQTFVFRVVEPVPLLVTGDDVVQYGVTSSLADEDNVTFNKLDNKYYVNGVNGWLKVNVKPFGMLTGSYPYTFSKRTPSSFQSTTDSVLLTLRTVAVDGIYDGTLKYPPLGQNGSEMAVNEQLLEEGEYVYTFVVNNRSIEIRVVVLAEPQLRVLNVNNNNTLLNFTNGLYFINNSDDNRFLEIELEPVNIDLKYKYIISDDGLFPIGADLTNALKDLVIVDNKMSIGITLPKVETPTREVFTYIIALYKGSVRIGTVSKVVIISEPPTSTIFFDTRGGTVGGEPILPITGYVDSEHGSIPGNVLKSGFSFAGWFTEPDFSVESFYEGQFFPSTDLILYANWVDD